MNALETHMLDLLKRLRDEYGVLAVKAEFEAEGSSTYDIARLKILTNSPNKTKSVCRFFIGWFKRKITTNDIF